MSRLERGLPGEQIVRNAPVNTGRVGISESLAAPGLASPPPVSRGVTLANQLQSALGSTAQAVHLAGRVSASERRDQQEQQRLTNLALRGQASQSAKETQPALIEAIENGDIRFDDAGGTDETINALIARETEGLGEAYTTAFSNAIKPALAKAFAEQQTREQDKNREAAHQYAIDLGGAGDLDDALLLSTATGTDERTARQDIGAEAIRVAVANRDQSAFDEAAGFLGSLDPSFVAQQRLKLAEAIESDKTADLAAQAQQAEDRLGELLADERYDAAVKYAKSLDLPGEKKDQLIERAKARKAEAMTRNEQGVKDLARQVLIRMDAEGADLDAMRSAVAVLPIPERDQKALVREHAKDAISLAAELGNPAAIEKWAGGLTNTREDQAFLVRQKEEARATQVRKQEAIDRAAKEEQDRLTFEDQVSLAQNLFLSTTTPGGINNLPDQRNLPEGIDREEILAVGLERAFNEIDNEATPGTAANLAAKVRVLAGNDETWGNWTATINSGPSSISADGEIGGAATSGFQLWRSLGAMNTHVRNKHSSNTSDNFYRVAEALMEASGLDEATALRAAASAWATFDGDPSRRVNASHSRVRNAAKAVAGSARNITEVQHQVSSLATTYLWERGVGESKAIEMAKRRWKETHRVVNGYAMYTGSASTPENLGELSAYAAGIYARDHGERLGIDADDVTLRYESGINRWYIANRLSGRMMEGTPFLSPNDLVQLDQARANDVANNVPFNNVTDFSGINFSGLAN